MNYPCSLIQDLLPLYAEDMVSAESKAAVEEHLAACVDCGRVLEQLRKPTDTLPPETVPLQAVKKSIRRRQWKTVAAAVCIVLAVTLSVFFRLTDSRPIPYTDGLVTITETEDGSLELQLNAQVSGAMLNSSWGEDGSANVYDLEMYHSAIGNSPGGVFTISPEDAADVQIYYVDYIHEDQLIYGSGNAVRQTLPRLALRYYLWAAAGLAAVLGVLTLLLQKKKAGKPLFAAFMAPVCYIAGQLCTKGLSGTAIRAGRDLSFVLVVGGCIYAAVLLVRDLHSHP